ncbi:hypothetical protein WJX73_001067 [Symbiochloris irregularis]|uniref:ATP-dependent Clp protease proteolytic subunit n=1 Tax=Symbiochloris irregularis TaxID=706552 RepID=A0AAW1P7J7_9CHLO
MQVPGGLTARCLSSANASCSHAVFSQPSVLTTERRQRHATRRGRQSLRASAKDLHQTEDSRQLWLPPSMQHSGSVQGAQTGAGTGYDEHKARKPPPDLPSIMLDTRIVYLGMPLVPAVTELVIAELLYLQHRDIGKPINLYINSTGTTRADGETVGFETEGTAVYDAMCFLSAPVYTLGVGVAMGQSCMLLSAGAKGHRFMLPHATAMLQQPRLPPTGQRQAIEVHIKWREVLAQKQNLLAILSKTTGHPIEKLDADLQRPLYMTAQDAIEYGIIDRIVKPQMELYGDVKKPAQWDKEAGLVERPAPGQGGSGWS